MRGGGMIRAHQLTGPNQKRVAYSLGGTVQYKMDDIPTKSVICGKKYVSRTMGILITFDGQVAKSDAGDFSLIRERFINSIFSQIQVDGTALGIPVSAAHYKPGIMDADEFISLNGEFFGKRTRNVTVTGNSTTKLVLKKFIPFGFYGCKSPLSMAPMTSLIRGGNMKIDLPLALALPFTAACTLSGTFTASAILNWTDEITLAPGYQVTRFKSTATAGLNSDTVCLNSFGQNSTLIGVQNRAAIIALMESTSKFLGDGAGAFAGGTVTDISALFAGIEQTNDLSPLFSQLADPFYSGRYNNDATLAMANESECYPFFSEESTVDEESLTGIANQARFLTVFPYRKSTDISKLPIADGSPNYQLTANMTGGDHYTYLWALYAWEQVQADALVEQIQKDDVGRFLYGSEPLTIELKMAKGKTDVPNFSKLTFLPRRVLPVSYLNKVG